MHANTLKPMAKRYMEDRRDGNAMARRVAELEAKLAAVTNGVVIPVHAPDVQEAMLEADKELFEAMTEDELRQYIFEKTQAKADGRLGHAALVNMAKGI
jgi:tRNA A-37 threonylcarbamoyl transferase component Bud32